MGQNVGQLTSIFAVIMWDTDIAVSHLKHTACILFQLPFGDTLGGAKVLVNYHPAGLMVVGAGEEEQAFFVEPWTR